MSEEQILKNKRSGYNIENVNKKKLSPPRFIENSSLSKQSLKLEKKLLIELNNIMKYFRDNYVSNLDPYNYRNVYEEFRIDMEDQIRNIIRSFVNKTYILAIEYVSDALNVSGFITKSDIDIIEDLTNNFTIRFLGRIRNVLESGIEKFYKNLTDIFIPASFNQNNGDNEEQINVMVKSIERSQSYIFSSLAILIISSTINRAIIIKTQKIILDKINNPLPIFQSSEDEIIDEMLQDFPMKKLDRVRTGNVFFIWKIVNDDRTCPVCLELEDHVYSIIDPYVPTPEIDTHFNCRCKTVLIYI